MMKMKSENEIILISLLKQQHDITDTLIKYYAINFTDLLKFHFFHYW